MKNQSVEEFELQKEKRVRHLTAKVRVEKDDFKELRKPQKPQKRQKKLHKMLDFDDEEWYE